MCEPSVLIATELMYLPGSSDGGHGAIGLTMRISPVRVAAACYTASMDVNVCRPVRAGTVDVHVAHRGAHRPAVCAKTSGRPCLSSPEAKLWGCPKLDPEQLQMNTKVCVVEGDTISPVLQVLRLDVQVYHSGEICRTANYPEQSGSGLFHFLIRGAITLQLADQSEPRLIDEPTLIGFPYASPHRLAPVSGQSHHLVCARLQAGNETARAVLRALPNPLVLSLREAREMALIGELLLGEAATDRQGSFAGRDLYARAMMLAAIRHALDQHHAPSGILRAMQNPRIARVLSAVLSSPQSRWSVAGMADLARMSRSAFAAAFTAVTDVTPQAFVTSVRIDLATELMARGHSIKQVAREVGYASASTFGRAYRAVTGRAPSASRLQIGDGFGD